MINNPFAAAQERIRSREWLGRTRHRPPRAGMKQNKDRIINRVTVNKDGEEERRRTIIPKDRSKYSPKPGEPVGKPKSKK